MAGWPPVKLSLTEKATSYCLAKVEDVKKEFILMGENSFWEERN